MQIAPPKRDWTNFVSRCTEDLDYVGEVSENLKQGIESLCKRLNTENIIFSNPNSSGTYWKSISILKCVCDELNPAIQTIFVPDTYQYDLINMYGLDLPLIESNLLKENCKEYADKFWNIYQHIDNIPPKFKPIGWEKLALDCTNFYLLAIIFDKLHEELKPDQLAWCELCFRRCKPGHRFCSLHTPLVSNEKGTFANTEYKKAKRILNKIPVELKNKMRGNVALHKLSSMGTSEEAKLLVLNGVIGSLVFDTLNIKWELPICKRWDNFLQKSPFVYKVFQSSAFKYTDWAGYKQALLDAVKNNEEKTNHPYLILLMLENAEIWLSYEEKYKDLRFTDTKAQIKNLANQGLTNSEIAKQLNMSRQNVSHVKKLI